MKKEEHEAIRLEIARQVQEFLDKGGVIEQLPAFTYKESSPVKCWERMNFSED